MHLKIKNSTFIIRQKCNSLMNLLDNFKEIKEIKKIKLKIKLEIM